MSKAPVANRWREAMATGTPEAIAQAVVPDCADEVVFYLLRAIDEGVLRLSYVSDSGDVVDLSEIGLGELSGWYMGSNGWRSQYSDQRFVDDFSDLGGGDAV
jgi:hypothetical protein